MKQLIIAIFLLLSIQKVTAHQRDPIIPVTVSVGGAYGVNAEYKCDEPENHYECTTAIVIGQTKTLYVLDKSNLFLHLPLRFPAKRFSFFNITKPMTINCTGIPWLEECR